MNNTSANNTGSKQDGGEGIDPEELPLFREFEAFVTAIYTEATKATSQELDDVVTQFSQTIAEKHTQHMRIADEVAATLPRIAEEFVTMAKKYGDTQQGVLVLTAGTLQQGANRFTDAVEHGLAKMDERLNRAADEFTDVVAKNNTAQRETTSLSARGLEKSAEHFQTAIGHGLAKFSERIDLVTSEIKAAITWNGAAQQSTLIESAHVLQVNAEQFTTAVEDDLAAKAVQISRAVDQATAQLGGEVDRLSKTIADSRESYFHLFEPFAEDLQQRNRVLLDEHLRHLRELQDNLASWPRELESRVEGIERSVREEIGLGRSDLATVARAGENAAGRQREEAMGLRRSMIILFSVSAASLLLSAGTLLILFLRH